MNRRTLLLSARAACAGAASSPAHARRLLVDTEIRHVTKPGASLFLELGFAPAEAKRLQAASRKQINDTTTQRQPTKSIGDA